MDVFPALKSNAKRQRVDDAAEDQLSGLQTAGLPICEAYWAERLARVAEAERLAKAELAKCVEAERLAEAELAEAESQMNEAVGPPALLALIG